LSVAVPASIDPPVILKKLVDDKLCVAATNLNVQLINTPLVGILQKLPVEAIWKLHDSYTPFAVRVRFEVVDPTAQMKVTP
jgi:hypothetical protein